MPRKKIPKTRQEIAYEKVEAARKKDPKASIKSLTKKLGVSHSNYYNEKAKREGRPYYRGRKGSKSPKEIPKVRTDKIAIPLPSENGRLIVLMGSPDQIREVLQ